MRDGSESRHGRASAMKSSGVTGSIQLDRPNASEMKPAKAGEPKLESRDQTDPPGGCRGAFGHVVEPSRLGEILSVIGEADEANAANTGRTRPGTRASPSRRASSMLCTCTMPSGDAIRRAFRACSDVAWSRQPTRCARFPIESLVRIAHGGGR